MSFPRHLLGLMQRVDELDEKVYRDACLAEEALRYAPNPDYFIPDELGNEVLAMVYRRWYARYVSKEIAPPPSLDNSLALR